MLGKDGWIHGPRVKISRLGSEVSTQPKGRPDFGLRIGQGRVRNGSLLSGPSSVALALHYCKSLAHPTNPSINFVVLD
ncbi:hypothetical protein WN944_025473 [Citrus x changshan-huyou]|uniref:Uncharacterized protein n=1 Tax=Citrus x changshan-huyou TaxID=2935761 RepID=A0AAP0QDL7_9ROSI